MKASLPIFVLLVLATVVVATATALAKRQSTPAETSPQVPKNSEEVGSPTANTPTRPAATYAGQRQPTNPATPAAAGSLKAGEAAYPDADALLRQAVVQLGAAGTASGTIEAKLRQRVALFDRELVGAGVYAQQGAGLGARLRLEMRIGSGERATELLQICDGETLWTFNAADGKRSLRRVDLDRIQSALEQLENPRDEVPRNPAGTGRGSPQDSARIARGTPVQSPSLGIGGLPWMLDGLRLNCDFTQVTPQRLGDFEVLALHGRWRKEKLLRLLADDERVRVTAGGEVDPDKLPAHLADQIVVYLGRDDLFPYRFDYLRSIPLDKKAKQSAEQASAQQGSSTKEASASATTSATPEFRRATPIMTLELYEVRFGGKLDRQLFTYKPGQPAIDDTQRHLDRLK